MLEKVTKETKQQDNGTYISKGLLSVTDMPAPDFKSTDRKIMSLSYDNQSQFLPLGI